MSKSTLCCVLLCCFCCDARLVTSNPLKAKLARNESVFGGFVTIPSYKTVENLAQGPLDFIWLEAEHTEWGSDATQQMVVACENEASPHPQSS